MPSFWANFAVTICRHSFSDRRRRHIFYEARLFYFYDCIHERVADLAKKLRSAFAGRFARTIAERPLGLHSISGRNAHTNRCDWEVQARTRPFSGREQTSRSFRVTCAEPLRRYRHEAQCRAGRKSRRQSGPHYRLRTQPTIALVGKQSPRKAKPLFARSQITLPDCATASPSPGWTAVFPPQHAQPTRPI